MSDAMQSPVIGTNKDDVLKGGTIDELFLARKGDDNVMANGGNDIAYGGRGNDTLMGQAGNDVLYGGGSGPSFARLDRLNISQDYQGTITFNGETAGYQNSIGWYKVIDGKIADVQIAWANASLPGSGGNVPIGSSKPLELHSGDQIGFFIVSNGAGQNDFSKFVNGRFEFRDATGQTASLDSKNPQLWFVSADGKATQVRGDGYHSAAYGDTLPLNNDGILHTVGRVDAAVGTVRIGFEDLRGGGDRDFDDAVITVNIGKANVQVLSAHGVTGQKGEIVDGGFVPVAAKPYVDGTENDNLQGGEGNDTLYGQSGHDRLSGDNGNDTIRGGTGTDVAYGGAGDDKIYGETGNDTLYGDSGNDLIDGGSGNDIGYGGVGNDSLNGGDGNDSLFGEDGIDVLSGGSGDDSLHGGTGDDNLDGGSDDDNLAGDSGDDVLSGGAGNDKLAGGVGNDMLEGGAGDDQLDGGTGSDMLDGGSGSDVLVGGEGADRLSGGSGEDVLLGGDGNDALVGGGDNDVLIGGLGADVLTGGSGNDTFVFRAIDAKSGVDTITTFEIGLDRIDVSDFFVGQKAGSYADSAHVGLNLQSGGLLVSIDADGADGAGEMMTVAMIRGSHDQLAKIDLDSFIL